MRGPSFDDILADGTLPLGDDLRRTVEGWLAHLAHERGAADKTLEAYARDLRQFLAWLKGDLGYAPCWPIRTPRRQAVPPLHGLPP
jgi:integrase/recombinase XerC